MATRCFPARAPAAARARDAREVARQPNAELLAELDAVYRETDVLYAGRSCPACTRCCQPRATGREPYVTSIELCAIARALAERGSVTTRPSCARGRRPAAKVEGICPLLTADDRCTIYAARPLGCRSFWCGRADGGDGMPHRRLLELVRRVQEIAARHQPGGNVGRPLRGALRAMQPRSAPARRRR